MQTITLTRAPFADALIRAITAIQAGGVIVSPTDTVYGLMCSAADEAAIRKMVAIKHRPDKKAFPIFVRDIATARRLAYISDAKAKFLEKIWPGPVTAVFHHKEKLPDVLTAGKDTIGIRIPDHPFIASLLARLDPPTGGALAQTSANISNMPPAKTAAEVLAYFENHADQPDLVIDGGTLSGAPSTVIDCTGASPLILRSGVMSKNLSEKFFREEIS